MSFLVNEQAGALKGSQRAKGALSTNPTDCPSALRTERSHTEGTRAFTLTDSVGLLIHTQQISEERSMKELRRKLKQNQKCFYT